ncbi:MAG: glycosyltransferase family 2 protein [Lachnospiraceae bacterium]|nr:glycosyltransferase family 2 protein [Lachnospiraceae bacterium]
MKVDIVIPTYHPDQRFVKTIEMLLKQQIQPEHIWIVNTEEKFWIQEIEHMSPKIHVTHIKKEAFDHGATRNLGASYSKADILLFMTQDAVPADGNLIGNMLKYMGKEKTATVYGRQLPNKDCSQLEKYTRSFNYGEKSKVKSIKDLDKMGIKTYFCSNVCAAYKRDIFVARNGFINKTIFNEDMIYCAGIIQAGYSVAYAADALVYHSHNYTPMEQLKRNFDLGVSQADHPEIFENVSSENEGVKMVKDTAIHFLKAGKPWIIISLVIQSAFKLTGYKLGKNYQKLSKKTIFRLTSNKAYWKEEE